MRQGKLKVIFNSRPSEITQEAVVLDVNGWSQRIPTDYGWIFAGGEPLAAFLKKIGIGFGPQELTIEGASRPESWSSLMRDQQVFGAATRLGDGAARKPGSAL